MENFLQEVNMNIKERKMLEHYRYLIENRLFDEYDIYGFLIFIRRHLPKGQLQLVHEFSDTVAHSERDEGLILANLKVAKANNYQTKDGRKVIGYNGYKPKTWNNEWKKLMNLFHISVNSIILKELTVCLFSLFQEVNYVDENGKVGKLGLFINPDHDQISIYTSEGKSNSYMVCFAQLKNIKIQQRLKVFFEATPAETCRENGILKLKNDKGIICEVE